MGRKPLSLEEQAKRQALVFKYLNEYKPNGKTQKEFMNDHALPTSFPQWVSQYSPQNKPSEIFEKTAMPSRAGIPKTSNKEKSSKPSIPQFHSMLILAKWALGLFQGFSIDPLRRLLNTETLEGIDSESGHTRFYNAIVNNSLFYLGDGAKCSREILSAYDLRIVGYWQKITQKRNEASGQVVRMKYFQYLSLLVTELYLDWYFNRRAALLEELNAQIQKYNENKSPANRLTCLQIEDLNKISFWEATGAGKTLLLHVNILQYRFYAERAGQKTNKVIVLTPNEGLTTQHLAELSLSGLKNDVMRDNELFSADTVNVIDSGKLISADSSAQKGEKRMMAESFEGNNLVLVDEGHHGSSNDDGERRRVREQLCRDGFAFEYSATFGQAIVENPKLKNDYARNILFDYSYKYFYEDGYGKESFILNLPDDHDDQRKFEYLCANLLKFHQQRFLYDKYPETMANYGVEKPLCLFVGKTVNSSSTKDDQKTLSDVSKIVHFFADVLNRREQVEELFARFIRDEQVLIEGEKNLLQGAFLPLTGMNAHDVYSDMLQKLFHSAATARLKLCHRKTPGEIVLSVGSSEPFAVINIGDCESFMRSTEGVQPFDVEPADAFSASEFKKINEPGSTINFLIGARKFMEGWSSWRVSAMGLLNVGQKEGTQIIQLFGRGVRLKGKDFSLKRSTRETRPKKNDGGLHYLETLNIFGVRANYMVTFRQYLKEEGIQTQDELLTLDFPIQKIPKIENLDLRIPQVKDGCRLNQKNGFKAKKSVTLFEIAESDLKRMKKPVFQYDDFAYLQVLTTEKSARGAEAPKEKTFVCLDKTAFDFFDWDGIYLRLMRKKAELGYRNLKLDKARLIRFVRENNDWYQLKAQKSAVTFDSFEKLRSMQALLETLLHGYMERFYKALQALYESDHMEMATLDPDDLPDAYRFTIENTDDGRIWQERLLELKDIVAKGSIPAELNQWAAKGSRDLVAITFDRHLYQPLLYCEKGSALPFTMKPISFDAPSEKRFVEDLKRFYENSDNKAYFTNVDLYLMRNASNRSRGIGFAQAGNFYPDFMMWIFDKKKDQRYLVFVDPKGLRNVPFESPKLNFAEEIKQLERAVNQNSQTKLKMRSFIISETAASELQDLFGKSMKDYEGKNVFFFESPDYLSNIFEKTFKEEPAS